MRGVEPSWPRVLAYRLERQHLHPRAPAGTDPIEVVGRLNGLHAQVSSSVELALWARIDGLDRAAVRDALWRDRTLVKLWAMRGTLHVLPARELGMWLAGLSTYGNGWPGHGLHEPPVRALADLIGDALRDRLLTRAELAEAVGSVEGVGPEVVERIMGSWGGALKPAAYLGRLCFGPSVGQRVRFTNPSTWLPDPRALTDPVDPVDPVDPGGALAEITARYLDAFGPATAGELGAWWGTNARTARTMLDALGERVTRLDLEGTPTWMLTERLADLAAAGPVDDSDAVRLLPGFDPWVICAARRDGQGSRAGPGEPALDPAYRTRVFRLQGWVSPVVLVGGRIEGTWRHERRGRRLVVRVEPFDATGPLGAGPLGAGRASSGARRRRVTAQVEAEVVRLGAFFDADPDLAWTPP